MSEKNSKRTSETDWERLGQMPDEEIDTSDIPPLDENFFREAELVVPEPKKPVTLRVDADVLSWFKQQGKGYQTRMNAVLRMYMQAHRGQ